MTSTDDASRPDTRRLGLERAAPPRPSPWNVPSAWNIPDVAPEESADPGRPLAALVSFHYLRAAVRRRRLRLVVPAVLGLLLGVAFLAVSPALPTATTTLILAHDPQVLPANASATDVSLLTTRTVAERTIQDLGLTIAPQELLNSVTPVSTGSSEILQITMTAPTNDEAVRRLGAFTSRYLEFRNGQVAAQVDILIKGYEKRIAGLQATVKEQTRQIDDAAGRGESNTPAVTDAVALRSKSNGQISDLQQLDQQAQLQRATVVVASKVLDPPAPLSGGRLRHVALVLASALIGGLAVGFVVVVLQAILTDRLWLRVEVGSALQTRVPLSVRRLAPLSRLARPVGFLPWVRAARERRSVDRQRMGHTIEQALMGTRRPASLAVLCLGNSDDMRFGLVAAGAAIRRHGRDALIVDLTARGQVEAALDRLADLAELSPGDRPEVFRPHVVPSLTSGPADLDGSDWDDVAVAKARSAVVLVLADLDPAVGVDHLTAWADEVVVAVTAGRSGVELVRTTADLVRSAGLRLLGAVLLRTTRDDMSSAVEAPGAEQNAEPPDIPVPRPDKPAERSLLS